MNIKTLSAAAALSTLLLAGTSQARPNVDFDYAKVVGVDPITKTIKVSTPRRECWNEEVAHQRYDNYEQSSSGYKSATPILLGSIIGGAIGNELGHHKDAKRGGMVVGALLGGSIGRDIQRRYKRNHQPQHASTYYTTEEVCKTYNDYHEEERIVGYDVAYKYHGRVYRTETREHPGKRLKVKVKVTPVHEY